MKESKIACILKWIFFTLAFLALLFVVIFSFIGCLNKQELDDLTVVSGIAVDEGSDKDALNLAVEYVTISSEGTTGKNVEGEILQLQGKDAFTALREALNKSQNKLYLVHNQLLVFGKELAEAGLKEHIDFFVRDYEGRLNVPVLIADGNAAEILQTKAPVTGLTSEFLKNMVEVQGEQGINIFTKMLDFTENIVSWNKGTLIPVIRIAEKESENPQLIIDSTAVFKSDTMVGTLDESRTRGVLWVMGLVKKGLVRVETSKGPVTVEITGSKVDKKISYEEDCLKVSVKILQSGIVGEAENGSGSNSEKNIKEIERVTKEAIEKEIYDGYKEIMKLNCDVYGIGDELRRKQNKTWKEIADNWETVFKNMDFTLEVESTIDNTGALGKDI